MIFSGSVDPADVRRALALGARGYVPKSADPKVLLSAMQFMLQGNRYVPELLLDAGEIVPEYHGGEDRTEGISRLTKRQLEVLKLLHLGLQTKEICRKLDLHEQTVKTHITAIFRALNVVNRTQAATAARRLGLV